MATLEDLYSYERAIENAWADILRSAGVAAFVEFQDAPKETPFVDVLMEAVQPLNGRPDAKTATLKTRVVTMRKKNSDRHYDLLARIRIEAANWHARFTPALLPFHRVADMRETGLTRGTEPEQTLDFSEITHHVTFSVNPDGWN